MLHDLKNQKIKIKRLVQFEYETTFSIKFMPSKKDC